MDAKIEQWQEVISQWRESGQTQKDFCRTRDIKLSTLHYWMKRVKKTSTAQAALPGLVRIAPPATSGGSTEIIIEKTCYPAPQLTRVGNGTDPPPRQAN
jgi:hypothetical protein